MCDSWFPGVIRKAAVVAFHVVLLTYVECKHAAEGEFDDDVDDAIR